MFLCVTRRVSGRGVATEGHPYKTGRELMNPKQCTSERRGPRLIWSMRNGL